MQDPDRPPPRLEKRLNGYLLEDVALWAGFERVPKELKAHLGVQHLRHPHYAVLDHDEAKRALAFCFHLHGLAVLERLRRAAKGQEPRRERTSIEIPDLQDPRRRRHQKKDAARAKRSGRRKCPDGDL